MLRTVRLLLLCLAAFGPAGPVQAQPAGDVALRVALLYNIIQFVQWPDGGGAAKDFQFCVVEGDELVAGLGTLDGQPLGAGKVRVRTVASGQLAGCQAVYLPAAGIAAPRASREAGLLTLSSGHGLVEQGAMVNVVQDGKRVAFDIGLGALRRAGMSLSAKVLRLARYVKED